MRSDLFDSELYIYFLKNACLPKLLTAAVSKTVQDPVETFVTDSLMYLVIYLLKII